MNRRTLLTTLAALPAASVLRGQSGPAAPASNVGHLKSGLVAYSYRTALAAKTMTYEDVIHMASDWGLDGIDLTGYWFPETTDKYLGSLRRLAERSGIQLYNLGTRVQLGQPTKELQDAQVDLIKKSLDIADRIGASCIRVFGGPNPKGAFTQEMAIPAAIDVLKRGAELASEKGITINVEDDAGLSATAEVTIAIVKGADSPWAAINADSGNLTKNGYDEFPTMLPMAASVHFKTTVADADGKHNPADWPRLLTMIAKSGYRGYVGLEYEGTNPVPDVPKFSAELRSLIWKMSAA